MKYLILALLISSSFAQASYFQSYCSNGEGTFKTASGHSENSITLTEVIWKKQASEAEVKEVAADKLGVVVEEENVTKVDREVSLHCDIGNLYGYKMWKYTDSKKLTLRRRNGGLFSPNIVGVSKDRKTVSAHVICEENGDNTVLCGK